MTLNFHHHNLFEMRISSFLLILSSVLFAFFGIELGYRYAHPDLEELKRERSFLDSEHPAGCRWTQTMYPHPHLGYTFYDGPPCGPSVEGQHIFGGNLPWSKRDDVFTLVVLGGSVAQHMASGNLGKKKGWIEEALNEKYLSPSGKPFLVISAAEGGWKQPNQIYVLLKSLGRIDGFLSIEGFNEAIYAQSDLQMEMPLEPFHAVSFIPDMPQIGPRVILMIQSWAARSFLKNSHAFVDVFARLRDSVRRSYLKHHEKSYLSTIFNYPHDWPPEKRINTNIDQYLTYIRAIDLISLGHSIPGALFLQPIPTLHRKLHSKDWPGRKFKIDPEVYVKLEKRFLEYNAQQIKLYSLTRIYENFDGWIYRDDIHAHVTNGRSPGYEIMAKEIVDRLAKQWKLRKK